MKTRIGQPHGIYEIGRRDNQEDALYPAVGKATVDDKIFILCDGMGGHEQGEVASETVSTTIAAYLTAHWPGKGQIDDNLIKNAVNAAFVALDARDDGAAKSMGTTLAMVVIHEGGCTAVHIGDSRIYHLRSSERRLLYRSRDHSLVTDLYQAGEISYDEMCTSPQKNIITKAMQPGKDNRVNPDIVHIGNLRAGDYLFLCSDGMMEQMDENQLIEILCANGNDAEKKRKIAEATAKNNDNHSAYLIHISEVIMDESEIVVDDEGTTRCNFLNIHPKVVEAKDVDINRKTEERRDKEILVPVERKDRRWLWLLLAAILALVFYAWVSLSGEEDDQALPQQQDTINIEPIRRIK